MESYPSIRIAYGMQNDRSARPARYWPFTNYQGQAISEDASGGPYSGAGSPYSDQAANSGDGSLADRIFGRQLAEGYLLLSEMRHVVVSRQKIHQEQMLELDELRIGLLNQLAIARRPYSIAPASQAIMLERLLIQTISERQREERAYWKDMAEVQREFLDTSFAYQASRQRRELLGGLERSYG